MQCGIPLEPTSPSPAMTHPLNLAPVLFHGQAIECAHHSQKTAKETGGKPALGEKEGSEIRRKASNTSNQEQAEQKSLNRGRECLVGRAKAPLKGK